MLNATLKAFEKAKKRRKKLSVCELHVATKWAKSHRIFDPIFDWDFFSSASQSDDFETMSFKHIHIYIPFFSFVKVLTKKQCDFFAYCMISLDEYANKFKYHALQCFRSFPTLFHNASSQSLPSAFNETMVKLFLSQWKGKKWNKSYKPCTSACVSARMQSMIITTTNDG